MTAIEEPGYLPFHVQAKANYNARGENEVSLIAGNTYVVVATDKKGLWWKSTDAIKGHTAWFPAAYTTVLPKGSTGASITQPRPDSTKTTLVQPAIQKTNSQNLPQQQQQQLPLPTPQPRPTPQQQLPLPSHTTQQPLPQPTPPSRQLPQVSTKPVPQLPSSTSLPQTPMVHHPVTPTPTLPQPTQNRPPVASVVSKEKLDMNQFVVVAEKPPPASKEKTHKEEGTYSFLKLQLIECKDMKGVDKNGTPTAFVVHKNPYEQGNQGTVLLQSETLKSANPAFNELFIIDVADPESTQIIVRFSNGKKHLTQGGGKSYIGEIKIQLRSVMRQEFSSPKNQFQWFPIKNGEEKTGEAKLYLEFTDLREKTNKGPTNVVHHGHIGIVNGVFSADNLPAEWKEQLKQAGVRKKDLNSPELRDLLFGLIIEQGGKIDPDDASTTQQSPQPQITTSSKSSPQPSLPSLPHKQPLPTPTNKTTPTPQPTPQLPPQRPMPQATSSNDDAPMMRGTPPPIKTTAVNSAEQPTGRAPRGPRGPAQNLGSTPHKTETEEKPQTTSTPKRENTQPVMPGGGDLMAEIAKGRALRSANIERPPEVQIEKPQGLAGALSAALEANRIALGGGLDNEDEGSDWD